MVDKAIGEAWISILSQDEDPARLVPPGKNPYNFGFLPAMGRLLRTHDRIGPAFMALFREVMFAPGYLDRREREMIAAVAAAAQDCYY